MVTIMLMFMLRCARYRFVSYRNLCSQRQSKQIIHRGERKTTSLIWMSANRLRLRDNLAVSKAAELGPDGLAMCVVWPYGTVAKSHINKDDITPVEAFGYAALMSLRDSLEELGQKLFLIPSEIDGVVDYDPVSVIANAVGEIQPENVIVDTCLLDQHQNNASRLRDKITNSKQSTKVVEIIDESLLIDYTKLPNALGRSRNGGRVLRWSTFLCNALSRREDLDNKPIWTLNKLPPPLVAMDAVVSCSSIPTVDSFPPWAKEIMLDWGDASEEEAIRRANMCTQRSVESNTLLQLSELESKDTKLSPYLRFGLISPQRAAKAGVRKRDLLWRDWSRVCYGLLKPLRTGEPVLQYMDKCNTYSYIDIETSEKELLNMWIVGNTGSQMVDAGMRQLWLEGWMPRRVRLLAAACSSKVWDLTGDSAENGSNVSIALSSVLSNTSYLILPTFYRSLDCLIDHDPAINELMWQNAGLVGVDPFYHGIKWEAAPNSKSIDDMSNEMDYVDKWMKKQLVWPSHLEQYAQKQPLRNIVEMAEYFQSC
eukprot:scaffold4438_cov56-Cyclotella_meneghiniana.AAC.1